MPAGSLEQRLTYEVTRLRAEAAELPLGDLRRVVDPTPANAIGTNCTGRPVQIVLLFMCSPAGASPAPFISAGSAQHPGAVHSYLRRGRAARTLLARR
jgi:hypothetical protein